MYENTFADKMKCQQQQYYHKIIYVIATFLLIQSIRRTNAQGKLNLIFLAWYINTNDYIFN